MKERPILFSAPMVRAILDGSKTQTRRVVKPQTVTPALLTAGAWKDTSTGKIIGCPYGQPGDQLWVRETFAYLLGTGIEHRATPCLAYAADTPAGTYAAEARKDFGVKWKPSIYMPRWASRIQIEITSVRIERLQDISGDDTIAEGILIPTDAECRPLVRLTGSVGPSKIKVENPSQWTIEEIARLEYANLWESINGPGSWDANPWVWVIEFKRI